MASIPADLPVVEASEVTHEALAATLERAFGFSSFRANQEAVCRAAIEGRDVLLVMPTGAGKSLCYQLPALARGGTTLVISPLIALMEDQATKLVSLGFSVARIHSGLDRETSRKACIDYLAGNLQFLFIAPERLRVPGFAAMLAKRKPSLIAIDEAHCISQWGHDFRPDYRMLGQSLPALRPAPVIALTATATPIVQDDIVKQLCLVDAERFIHGFRRKNLAIEVVEVAPARRTAFTLELLNQPGRRPAIVYAPSRKQAEALAAELSSSFPAAAYHAGFDAAHRDRVQRSFLGGRLETVVATIAFGMGIDKADVRTVIHTALPASLESYYQEIGRAGRDGEPSRTILMHSFADRNKHDFFYEQDYPAVPVLDEIYRALGADPRPRDEVRAELKMDAEVFDRALEKLAIHGGCVLDFADNVARGHGDWKRPYSMQANQRRSQLDLLVAFAEGNECRMAALVRHFGDVADGKRACGECDFCAPEQCIGQRYSLADAGQQRTAQSVLKSLRLGASRSGPSSGKLYKELFPSEAITRDQFEELLSAMMRAGLLLLEDATFEKDGRSIPYRKVFLTRDGESLPAGSIELLLKDVAAGPGARRKKKAPADRGAGSASYAPGKAQREGRVTGAPSSDRFSSRTASSGRPAARARHETPLSPGDEALEKRLRTWRLEEARKLGVPAFVVCGDQTLRAIAAERPGSLDVLLTVPGIGPAKVEKFGEAICRICAG
ncbi:MAG TPA: ATP-dependent DNA helicase RecQ [Acidisarcina sp.]